MMLGPGQPAIEHAAILQNHQQEAVGNQSRVSQCDCRAVSRDVDDGATPARPSARNVAGFFEIRSLVLASVFQGAPLRDKDRQCAAAALRNGSAGFRLCYQFKRGAGFVARQQVSAFRE
jgi:hypothetical protein